MRWIGPGARYGSSQMTKLESGFDAGYVVVPKAAPMFHRPPDSVELMAECGHQVWVTPDGLSGHDEPAFDCPIEYVCSHCWLSRRIKERSAAIAETRLAPGVFEILQQRDPDTASHAAHMVHDMNTAADRLRKG